MGNTDTRYTNEISDDSSDEDFDYRLEPHPELRIHVNPVNKVLKSIDDSNIDPVLPVLVNNYSKEMNLTTDAATSLPRPESVLSLDTVLKIEKDLDAYEIISLVYLLYDDPNYALQELALFLSGAHKTLLHSWATVENCACKPWQKKLIEALCIIKNYQILRTLGYNKQDAIVHYLPHQANAITSINKVRKSIYLICEKLDCEKTDTFLKYAKAQLLEKKMKFTEYDREFLELYFLNWENIGFVRSTDLSSIKSILKVMEEESLCDIIQSVSTAQSITETKRDISVAVTSFKSSDINIQEIKTYNKLEDLKKPPKQKRTSTSTDTHQQAAVSRESSGQFQSSIDQQNNSHSNELGGVNYDKYEIDPANPGIVLIINEECFYTEIDPKFKHLLPKEIEKSQLESRLGTQQDKLQLTKTFERYGFKVICRDNLTHEELIQAVKDIVKSVKNESSLFVCILSHGEKGAVYASNSCRVEVSEIKDIMGKKNKNLIGKPKILILQSCQGKACQRVNEISDDEDECENSLTTDGPNSSKPSVPQTVDLLTFWATIPGYAAIRNKTTGSWFIQALCKKMVELSNRHHFADICTRIINDVTSKTWTVHKEEKNVMTPTWETTLRYDFFLPPLRNN